MKTLMKIALVIPVLLALLLAGCSLDAPSDPTGKVNDPGIADAGARYVAIGNSLTAGFMDGGLMKAGQINSYPRLIANQLGLDNEQFTQPWIDPPGIGSSTPSAPDQAAGILYFDGSGLSLLGETPLATIESILPASTQPTAYHNLGVPGALLTDGRNAVDRTTSAGAALGSPNPFFDFINRLALFGNTTVPLAAGPPVVTTESNSMHYKAIAKGGALTTVWLGNNDVLGAATSGNPNNPVPITDINAFTAEYTAMLQTLAGGLANRNGFPPTIVTANIPSITSAPYFMPESLFDNVVQDQIGASWPGGYAETNVQVVLFPALSWITANPPSTPLPSTLTLTDVEVQAIDTAVTGYNAVIAQVTAGVNAAGIAKCAMMDSDALLNGLQAAQKTHFLLLLGQGLDIATAASTTAFSLDGIHPNNVGYGIVANGFIDVINDLDGTSIPDVDLAGLSWDPTYGVPPGVPIQGRAGGAAVTPEAASAMGAIFR
jgi:hypothetical protein